MNKNRWMTQTFTIMLDLYLNQEMKMVIQPEVQNQTAPLPQILLEIHNAWVIGVNMGVEVVGVDVVEDGVLGRMLAGREELDVGVGSKDNQGQYL